MSCCSHITRLQVSPCLGVGSSLWNEDVDITSENEQEYRAAVLKNINSDVIKTEASNVVFGNLPNRAQILCECLISDRKEIVNWTDLIAPETGTSLLHYALLAHSDEVAETLIKEGGKSMIMLKVASGFFKGTTSLHIAVVNGKTNMVKLMLDAFDTEGKKALIRSQVEAGVNMNDMELSGCTLAQSVWGGHKDLFDLLIENGAEIDEQDYTTGNTILHTIIFKNRYKPAKDDTELFEYILNGNAIKSWWAKKNNLIKRVCGMQENTKMKKHILSIKNFDGYTPLNYATLLGTQNLINAILNVDMVYKFINWHYGGVTQTYYNINEIEPSYTRIHEPSMLILLAYAHEGDNMDILTKEPIKTVVEEKWKTASKFYTMWAMYHTLVMTVLTVTAIYRKTPTSDTEQFDLSDIHSNTRRYVFIGEIISGVATFIYFLSFLFHISKNVYLLFKSRICRDQKFYKAPLRVIFTVDIFWMILHVYSISTLTYLILHTTRSDGEEPPLCIALIFGWYFVLYFTRAFQATGFFTVMLHRMLFGDLSRFALVILIYILGFGSAFVVMFQGAPNGTPDEANSFGDSLLAHFKLFLGLSDINVLAESTDHVLAYILYFSFVILATLELLNMLIAAMSDTYAVVSENKMNVWQHERLKCIMLMENNMPDEMWKFLVKMPYQYSERHSANLLTVYEIHCRSDVDNNLL